MNKINDLNILHIFIDIYHNFWDEFTYFWPKLWEIREKYGKSGRKRKTARHKIEKRQGTKLKNGKAQN